MPNQNRSTVILDSDFLIALFLPDQSTHRIARALYEHVKHDDLRILELVQFEMATTLSYKYSQKDATRILSSVLEKPVRVLRLEQDDVENAWNTWFSYARNGTSFVDCANLAMARKLNAKIASFDRFYPEESRVS